MYFFEKSILLLFAFHCVSLTDLVESQTLEVVSDDELLELCRSENQVVVLFSMYRLFYFLSEWEGDSYSL